MAIWKNHLKGGWAVENVRLLDDHKLKWQGEVTFDADDIQTCQWTFDGKYYANMDTSYDLVFAEDTTPATLGITRQALDAGETESNRLGGVRPSAGEHPLPVPKLAQCHEETTSQA